MEHTDAAITLCPADLPAGKLAAGTQLVELAVDAGGESVRVRAAATPGRARLADIVPVARELAKRATAATIRRLRRDGGEVPCRRGCGDCCAYLAPVSVPEAMRLTDEIRSLPEPQRHRLTGAMLAAGRRLLQAGAPSLPEKAVVRDGRTIRSPAGAAGEWYAGLGLICPLLDDQAACRFYARRPLACIEHIVSTSAAFCRRFQPGRGHVVRPGVSVLEALATLAAEAEQAPVESTLIPLLPAWADINAARARRTWPAGQLLQRFAAVLDRLGARARAA